MRLFRTEEAARKAGAMPAGIPYACYWGVPASDHDVFQPAMVLTDRERALLGALERVLAIAAAGAKGTDESVVADIEEFVKSLNVEG